MTLEEFTKMSGLDVREAAVALYRGKLSHMVTSFTPDDLTILVWAAEVVEAEHAVLAWRTSRKPENTAALFDGGEMLQVKKQEALIEAAVSGVERVMKRGD